jgi:hypothetical protein
MFCRIGLQATTTEISAYMICQSYWQSKHERGTCVMVLRHILAVLCEVFSVIAIMTDGQVEEDPLHGLHAHLTSVLWIFTCRDTWKPSCMQLLLATKKHFTVALWLTVRLSATAPASLNWCGGPRWDVSRFTFNLMENTFSFIINVVFQL